MKTIKNILFKTTFKICGWLEDKFLSDNYYNEWSTEEGHVGHFSGGGRLTYCEDTEGDGIEGIKLGSIHWVRSYQLSDYSSPVITWYIGGERWRIVRYLKYLVCRRFVDSRIRIIRDYCFDFVLFDCCRPHWDREYIANKIKRSIIRDKKG